MSETALTGPRHLRWAIGAGIAVALGVALLAAGVTPWLAAVAVLFGLTLGLAQYATWTFSFAAAVITTLAGATVALRLALDVGGDLVGAMAALSVVMGGLGVFLFLRGGGRRVPRLAQWRTLVPAVVLPLILVGAAAWRAATTGDLEWAMHNDAVWNLVTTRLLIDGGAAGSPPNASPLTPGVLAAVAAVGRGAVAPADLLRHDVGRFADTWLVLAALTSVLAGLIGAQATRGASAALRSVAAAGVGLIPLTWFIFGFAAQFGFYNATLALVLLLASWLVWTDTRDVRLLGCAVLSLASVALLATWAPVAAVTFALAAVSALSWLRVTVRSGASPRAYIALGLAMLPVPLYAVVVTLPDLRREGAALAVDGGFMALAPVHVVLIAATTLTVALLAAAGRRGSQAALGVTIAGVAALGAVGYLMWQRLGTPSLWGYYPAKFSWLVCSLLLVVLASRLLFALTARRHRRTVGVGLFAVAAVLPLGLMAQVPAPQLASVITPVALVTHRDVAAGQPAARTLFELAEPGHPTLALSLESPEVDRFVNAWLLQLESTQAEEPIRLFSYLLEPGNEPQACDAVRAWGAPVRIVTSDDSLPERFAELCDVADVTVDVLAR